MYSVLFILTDVVRPSTSMKHKSLGYTHIHKYEHMP